MLKERYLKQIRLAKLKDLNTSTVICEEINTGREWILPKQVFKRFKRSGFAILPKELEDTIYNIFRNKDYNKLSVSEKLEVIETLLTIASKD